MNTMEIPDFLLEMSEQINTQENHATAEPIWQVCYNKWLTCADGRGDKIIILLYDGDEYFNFEDSFDFCRHINEEYIDNPELFKEFLKINEADSEFKIFNYEWYGLPELKYFFDDLPFESIELIEMQKIREVVKTCLTESDAQFFIDRKQHDYPKLYKYVESMVFCPQMIELRNWIKGLKIAIKQSNIDIAQ